MPSQGPKLAGAGSSEGSGTEWTNPGNITTSDNAYATSTVTASGVSDQLRGVTWGFTIPTGSLIEGIILSVERIGGAGLGTIEDYTVHLKTGTKTSTNKAIAGAWDILEETINYGGATDTWGQTWTVDEINESGGAFAVEFTVQETAAQDRVASVDSISLTVYYSTLSEIAHIYQPQSIEKTRRQTRVVSF